MKETFTTLYGKAIIEKNILFIRSFDVPFTRTAFAKILYLLFFVIAFILQFFIDEEPRKYVGVVLFGLMLLFRLPDFYDVLIKRNYSNRIILSNIKSVKTENDTHGLNTTVVLQLKNGRYRKIIFRTMEKQHESFSEILFQHTTAFQLA